MLLLDICPVHIWFKSAQEGEKFVILELTGASEVPDVLAMGGSRNAEREGAVKTFKAVTWEPARTKILRVYSYLLSPAPAPFSPRLLLLVL